MVTPPTATATSPDREPALAGPRNSRPDLRLRLSATLAARRLIDRLQRRHGPLMLHQAAGPHWLDAPQCFVQGAFPLTGQDLLLGVIDGTPFYASRDCHRRYGSAPVRLDAVPGRAGVFALERATGWRFWVTCAPPR